mgnify:CR=1 FL=1
MNNLLTKETLQHIESLLLSGDSNNIELGLLLATSQEIDLEPILTTAKQLCDIFLSKGLNNDTERLLRLTQLERVTIHVGWQEEISEHSYTKGETIGHVDSFEKMPEDWATLLPNLIKLTIVEGKVETLPPEIGHLPMLQTLALCNVSFKKFPPSFKNLRQLKVLDIYHPIQYYKEEMPFFSLPEEISYLDELQELRIESCLLSFIPEQIQQLPALRKLYINCDPEALFENPEDYKKFNRRKDIPKTLHFVPNTLAVLPRLEELTLLLPSRHFPLSAQLFQNSHLRHLQLSSRLVNQLPLHSKELGRLKHLEIFKPSLLQHLHLTFALPDTTVEPMQHHYIRSLFWQNLLLLLLMLPCGNWYFSFDLLVNQICLPIQKGYSKLIRITLALILYPFAFIVFITALLYSGLTYLFKPKRKALNNDLV